MTEYELYWQEEVILLVEQRRYTTALLSYVLVALSFCTGLLVGLMVP